MAPPLRIDGSPSAGILARPPSTMKVMAMASPMNPVKMLSIATSRFWINKGFASPVLGGGATTASPPSSCPAAASAANPRPPAVAPTPAVSLAGTCLAMAAARAWPISQMPFTMRTTPTYSNTTPVMGCHSLSCWPPVARPDEPALVQYPRRRRLPALPQRTPALFGHHEWFVGTCLLLFQHTPHRSAEPREARRGKDPPSLTEAGGAVCSRANLSHRSR